MFVKLDTVKSLWIRESEYFAYYLRWRKPVQRPWVVPEHHLASFIDRRRTELAVVQRNDELFEDRKERRFGRDVQYWLP